MQIGHQVAVLSLLPQHDATGCLTGEHMAATLPWPDAAAKAEITCNAATAHHVAHLGYGHIRPHYPVWCFSPAPV